MNPILDTRMYQVEFAGGNVAELPANIIAGSMYAQCDAFENKVTELTTNIIPE